MSFTRTSTSSASFFTDNAASLMWSTAPFVLGEPRKLWALVNTPSTLSAELLSLADIEEKFLSVELMLPRF